MRLEKGAYFHSRYLLVSQLGNGASAEVWAAKDTKANNLIVALKIFSPSSSMDSYGLQNFEKEFTTVYNLKHSNLLPPTGYDIYEGRPYLIMQYCENGSCGSMIGRTDENDIIKFLHDVAAGLEYLHDHNIIHQDIKPDNILLDDNCNFMVTDFGISIAYNNASESSEISGGTRAYMGPERFNGITNTASDIWSLGATAVELLTGNPPYGDHGGLLQAEGEPLPELPDALLPEVKNIILSCLAADPMKRIKANEIRQKIELYWETGSWERQSNKKLIAIVATSVASVLMCLGIFLWDYNRTKVYYYKDYAEYWGIPKGIGRLTIGEMKHRDQSYRFECQQWKVRRMALVNSAGKVISHSDTEHMLNRSSDVRYYYTANGDIDYKAIYDTNGRLMYKMDYDENLKTATFRLDDGAEMNLDASTTKLYKASPTLFDEKSNISRYLLTYNEDGLLMERRYAGYQNVKAVDAEKIHGQRYLYDDKGRIIEEQFLGIDGNITGNRIGLAIKVNSYNENDDWTSTTYLNAERKPSHDGNNCSIVKLDYDDYGNRIRETYFTYDGNPALRTDAAVFGYSYTYDEHGFRIAQSCLGMEGQVILGNAGFAVIKSQYNENGFLTEQRYYDDQNNPVKYTSAEDVYGIVRTKPNECGQYLELCYYDEFGNELENSYGFSRWTRSYDEEGKITQDKYYSKGDSLALWAGFYNAVTYTYDEHDNLSEINYFDRNGNLTPDENGVASYKATYNHSGVLTKIAYYNREGKLVLNSNRIAGYTVEYDELGNQKSLKYFGVDRQPCMSSEGYANVQYDYDKQTNLLTSIKEYDTRGNLLSDIVQRYDERGNVILNYTKDGKGRLLKNTAIAHSEYDTNNRCTRIWYTDLEGKRVNMADKSYCEVKNKYDERGNCIECSFWDSKGKPATDEFKTHKRIQEFDAMNRVVYEKNLNAAGKPSVINPEGRVTYDQFGNQTEILCYDGYGKPSLSADGYHIQKNEYNKRNKLERISYLGLNKELVASKSENVAMYTFAYDNKGNRTEMVCYNADRNCIRLEKTLYNDKNKDTELQVYNGKKQLTDEFYGFARCVVEYDESGVVPKLRKYYSATGKLLGSQTYNPQKSDWEELRYTNQGNNGSNWIAQINDAARQCPLKMDNGVTIQAISVNGNSVTITFKLEEHSKYNMDESLVSQFRQLAKEQLTPYIRQSIGIPNNVSVRILLTDKANREICTI